MCDNCGSPYFHTHGPECPVCGHQHEKLTPDKPEDRVFEHAKEVEGHYQAALGAYCNKAWEAIQHKLECLNAVIRAGNPLPTQV